MPAVVRWWQVSDSCAVQLTAPCAAACNAPASEGFAARRALVHGNAHKRHQGEAAAVRPRCHA